MIFMKPTLKSILSKLGVPIILFLIDHDRALADFYWEPKVGVSSALVSYNLSSSVSDNTKGVGGLVFQSILGSHWDSVYLGFDFRYDQLNQAVKDLNGDKVNLSYLSAGLGFGYTLTYLPLKWFMSLDLHQSGWLKSSEDSFESSGYRVGIGYYLTENFLVNFEYSEPYYKSKALGTSFQTRIYTLNLSFPMDFPLPDKPWKESRGLDSESDSNSNFDSASNSASDGAGAGGGEEFHQKGEAENGEPGLD